jgi:hypothetical protein
MRNIMFCHFDVDNLSGGLDSAGGYANPLRKSENADDRIQRDEQFRSQSSIKIKGRRKTA